MAVVLHALNGKEVQVEASEVGFIGSANVDGRKATRITLTCGAEVIVIEDASVVFNAVMLMRGKGI